MKADRFKYKYRDNASRLHKKIGEVLRSGIFSNYKVFQEYPVNKIKKDYYTSRHKFDWVVLDLSLVIEVHGQQHFTPSTFGGISAEEAEARYLSQKNRDNVKMDAAVDAGFTYIAIKFSDVNLVNEDYILKLYKQNLNTQALKSYQQEETQYGKDVKERARQYRHQQYMASKERRLQLRRLQNEKEGHSTHYSSSQDSKTKKT